MTVSKEDVKAKVHGVDVAFTEFNECLEVDDLDGAHAAISKTLLALGGLDEAFWVYAHRPIEVAKK